MTLAAPSDTNGTAALTGRVSDEDENGIPGRSDRLSIPVQVTPDRRFAVDNVTSSLTVGEEGTISGVITNTGDQRVDNLQLALPIESPTMTPIDATAAVGTLAPGERTPFSFQIEVSEDGGAGHRQFTLRPTFRTVDGTQRSGQSIDIRVPVEGATEQFAVEAINASVEQGGSARLALAVTNTGSDTVRDVSAQLFADSPISTTDKRAYVPALDPGETAELTFGIAASGALPKAYPMSVDFEFETPDGETKLSDTYSVAVQVADREESGLPLLEGAIGVGLLAGIVIVVMYVQRRRSRY
ncbi:MAG: COG1361 S-layer family protein [Halococcoides sp.]